MSKVTIDLTSDLEKKLNAIRERFALTFLSETLRLMIILMHEREFPVGRPALTDEEIKRRVGRPILSDGEIAAKPRTVAEKKKIMEADRIQELTKLATSEWPDGLAGKVSDDGKFVTYFTYFERGRDERTILLREVNKDLIDVQFEPSHDEIIRMQSEGKVDYEI